MEAEHFAERVCLLVDMINIQKALNVQEHGEVLTSRHSCMVYCSY
jgi:hypothetical protein